MLQSLAWTAVHLQYAHLSSQSRILRRHPRAARRYSADSSRGMENHANSLAVAPLFLPFIFFRKRSMTWSRCVICSVVRLPIGQRLRFAPLRTLAISKIVNVLSVADGAQRPGTPSYKMLDMGSLRWAPCPFQVYCTERISRTG